MSSGMDHEAESYGLIRWMLTTAVVANGLALLAVATTMFAGQAPVWMRLLLVPSGVVFMVGIIFGATAVTALSFHHLSRGIDARDRAMPEFWSAAAAGVVSYGALIIGIAWPLLNVVNRAATGSL